MLVRGGANYHGNMVAIFVQISEVGLFLKERNNASQMKISINMLSDKEKSQDFRVLAQISISIYVFYTFSLSLSSIPTSQSNIQ